MKTTKTKEPNFRNFDCVVHYKDNTFKCEADFKFMECDKPLINEDCENMLRDFCKELGQVQSITIIFNH